MSTLFVENLKGLTSGDNANKVIIPSGQTFIAAGHILQTVSNSFTTYTAGTSTTFFDTTVNISLTTTVANSKVMYLGMLGFNASSSKYMHARLLRRISGSDTEIWAAGRITPAGSGSTADVESWHAYNYVDDHSQPAGTTIEYRIQIRNSGVNSGGSARINDNSESYVILQELAP